MVSELSQSFQREQHWTALFHRYSYMHVACWGYGGRQAVKDRGWLRALGIRLVSVYWRLHTKSKKQKQKEVSQALLSLESRGQNSSAGRFDETHSVTLTPIVSRADLLVIGLPSLRHFPFSSQTTWQLEHYSNMFLFLRVSAPFKYC